MRWKELAKNGLDQDRIVEPVPYFQRPFYLNGDLEGVVKTLRNATSVNVSWEIPQLGRLEMFVMTMLASKQALKKLSEGKMPPPPVLQSWEPGQKMIQILDYYINDHTNLFALEQDMETSTRQTTATMGQSAVSAHQQQLAWQARLVEREIVLMWRHAIATNHGLYMTEASGVERWLPAGNKKFPCCVQCRASLRVASCPQCHSVYYCGEACRQLDLEKGHGRICALLAARLGSKG